MRKSKVFWVAPCEDTADSQDTEGTEGSQDTEGTEGTEGAGGTDGTDGTEGTESTDDIEVAGAQATASGGDTQAGGEAAVGTDVGGADVTAGAGSQDGVSVPTAVDAGADDGVLDRVLSPWPLALLAAGLALALTALAVRRRGHGGATL